MFSPKISLPFIPAENPLHQVTSQAPLTVSAGEPPYLIPTPTALYFCTVGPTIFRTGKEYGSWEGGWGDSA